MCLSVAFFLAISFVYPWQNDFKPYDARHRVYAYLFVWPGKQQIHFFGTISSEEYYMYYYNDKHVACARAHCVILIFDDN